MLKYLEKLLEFLKPIIASGKTRFLVTITSVLCETYIARYASEEPYANLAMLCICIIAVVYVVLKTSYDYYVVKKIPADKLGQPRGISSMGEIKP